MDEPYHQDNHATPSQSARGLGCAGTSAYRPPLDAMPPPLVDSVARRFLLWMSLQPTLSMAWESRRLTARRTGARLLQAWFRQRAACPPCKPLPPQHYTQCMYHGPDWGTRLRLPRHTAQAPTFPVCLSSATQPQCPRQPHQRRPRSHP